MMRRSTDRQVALRNLRQRPSYIAAVGGLLMVVAAVVVYVGLRSPYGVPLRDYGQLQVQAADPSNLQVHDPVRVAGVRVGQVTKVEKGTGPARGQSVIAVELDPGIRPLPRDTQVKLRAAGLLGARYVELLPGRSDRALPWGSTIRAGRDAVSYGVTDVLDTFDERTRAGLDQMVMQFGRGLFTRGQGVNSALRLMPEGEADFRRLAAAIRARPGAARRFIPSAESAASALDGAREDVAGMLRPTARGLRPFAGERGAVRETLDRAPAALTGLDAGMRQGRRLLRAARDLSEAARTTLPDAPAGLRATTALLAGSGVPLARTTRLLTAVRPTVPSLLRITKALDPNLAMLGNGLNDAARLAKAIAPYNCDLENGAHSFRSLIGYPVGPNIDGGNVGPWTGFRAVVIAGGPEITGTLTPTIGGTRGVKAEPYPAACKYSPGHRYEAGHLVTPYPNGGGR